MSITRFSPTSNGILHLGHMFALLVNEYIAHTTGGKFYVRFDDLNTLSSHFSVEKLSMILHSQMEDIKWLGLEVDGWMWQSALLPDVRQQIVDSGHKVFPDVAQADHKIPYFVRMTTDWVAFPYVCQQTAERVIMDHAIGVTHLIRGDDFATEYALYCYFCQLFDYPIPEFVFLPRLSGISGDISKSHGGYKIVNFREEGYSPDKLKQLMMEACLHYPKNGWELYNIRSNPRLNI